MNPQDETWSGYLKWAALLASLVAMAMLFIVPSLGFAASIWLFTFVVMVLARAVVELVQCVYNKFNPRGLSDEV